MNRVDEIPEFRASQLPAALSAMREDPSADSERSLEALRSLLDPDDLRIVFQPIVDLLSGTAIAIEALVRCRIPAFRYPPALFDRAVAIGCIGRLGRLVREIATSLVGGRAPLFLNIHPAELEDSWLVRPDDPIFLHETNVYLELTESVPMTHFDVCAGVLRELSQRGNVNLVIDDLGAGYSNLKRIADLEPKVVKLDRDLISGIDKNERQRKLVRRVVRMCTDLGADVVAEGIETEGEYSALIDTGMQFGQGFLLARPAFPVPCITLPPASQSVVPPNLLS